MKRSTPMIWLVALLLGSFLAVPGRAEDHVSLPTRSGETQSFYLTKPATPPIASLILFPGAAASSATMGRPTREKAISSSARAICSLQRASSSR